MRRRGLVGVSVVVALFLALTGCVYRFTPVAGSGPDAPIVQPTAEPVEPALPRAQQQAIAKAESYLSFSSFSRTGLIKQLEFEGFETADATFGVDYLDVDWNAQAAAKAAEYLKSTSFSKQSLTDQLLFEGFTADEAAYGVQAVGF